LNIDLSKSYDRVCWSYIRLILTHLGFEVPFITWLMECISIVSFTLLINGRTSPFFKSERGIRHGCTLSPLPFLLVDEGLSRDINQASINGDFQGISISPTLRITHLLFMDDLLIFCNSLPRDVEKLANILQLFWNAIGMLINQQKSTLSTIGTTKDDIVFYKSIFPFHVQYVNEGLK
jgi:hypothetical protein